MREPLFTTGGHGLLHIGSNIVLSIAILEVTAIMNTRAIANHTVQSVRSMLLDNQ